METEREKICVIIPTYNNAGTIAEVVTEVLRYSGDVLVVDDGSTDSTPEILSSLLSSLQKDSSETLSGETAHPEPQKTGSSSPAPSQQLRVITHERNRGKGAALRTGFLKARSLGYTHAVTIDSDLQHYPDDLPGFFSAIERNPRALIVGSRNIAAEGMPQRNTFANRFSNFWFRLYTGVRLSDTQTGYRAYPLSGLSGLGLLTSRYEAELELLVFAAWRGTPIESIPIKVYYPPEGERVTHFRPVRDFGRISLLNTVLLFVSIFYGIPCRVVNRIKRCGATKDSEEKSK